MDCGGNCLHGVRCKNLGLNDEVRPHDTKLYANPHVSDRLEWRTTIGADDVLIPVGDFIFNLPEAGLGGEAVEIGLLVRTRPFFTWMPVEVTSVWKRDPWTAPSGGHVFGRAACGHRAQTPGAVLDAPKSDLFHQVARGEESRAQLLSAGNHQPVGTEAVACSLEMGSNSARPQGEELSDLLCSWCRTACEERGDLQLAICEPWARGVVG